MHRLKVVPSVENNAESFAHSLAGRHLISLHDLTSAEIEALLELTKQVKTDGDKYRTALAGRSLAMIHEKPSLHTRITSELGISQLGGYALSLTLDEVGIDTSEAVKDVARNLSQWVDAILMRVESHQRVLELAAHSSVPVINGLTDFENPCQVLADYFTLRERKETLANLTLAWVGDGNNVAHSLIYGAARLGVHMRIATPPGYEPDRSVMADAKRDGGDVTLTHDPRQAVADADVVYTDVWTSMGMEHEAEARQDIFRAYQVDSALMRAAKPDAQFMHCQPAHRGEEVTDEVMDSSQSLATLQAENRLHMQKAIFLALLS